MCGCKKNFNTRPSAPTVQNGANQAILRQIEDQQRQQQEIKRIIEQSNNPNKTLIKTYR